MLLNIIASCAFGLFVAALIRAHVLTNQVMTNHLPHIEEYGKQTVAELVQTREALLRHDLTEATRFQELRTYMAETKPGKKATSR